MKELGQTHENDSSLQPLHFLLGSYRFQSAARTVQVYIAAYHNSNVFSATRQVEVNVQPVNDAPVVTGTTESVTYVQRGAPVSFASTVALTDDDHKTLSSVTIQIANGFPGDTLSTSLATTPGIKATYTPDTSTLVLSGSVTVAAYQVAVRSLKFYTTAQLPYTQPRYVSIAADDGTESSSPSPLTIISICATKGFYANAARARVQACAQGSYQTQTCATECTSCAVGTFGKALANALAPGTSAAAHCETCTQGTYQNQVGQTTCTDCAAGRFGSISNSVSGSSHCQPCSIGTAQSATGTTSCTGCTTGEFSNSEAQISCTPFSCCGAGTYKFGESAESDGICAVCAQGTFKTTTGSCLSACSACGTGKYGSASTPGSLSSHCVNCAVGRFQGLTGQNNGADGLSNGCAACASGTYTSSTGHSVCTACEDGRYQTSTGQSACDKCAKGTYGDTNVAAQSSASYCVSCSSGRFNEADGKHGASHCAPCNAGKHADPRFPTSDARHCADCEVGRYESTVALTAQCKTCANGQFQTGTGAVECTGCTVGACESSADYVAINCESSADRICLPRPTINGVSGSVLYIENAAAVALTTVPAIAFHADARESVHSVVVALAQGATSNDKLSFDAQGSPFFATVTEGDHRLVLTVSSAATRADFESALTGVKFHTTGQMMSQTSNRNVGVEISAATTQSNNGNVVFGAVSTMSVTVQPVNDQPIVTPTSTAGKYTQNGAPLAFASLVTVADVDHTHLQRATIKIESPQDGDKLVCSPTTGSISSSSDVTASAEVVLSGTATIAQYEAALRTCTFEHASNGAALSTASREISVFVFDGLARSTSVPVIQVPICAAIGYYSGSSSTAVACPAGTFTTDACNTQCTPCGSGTFGSSHNTCQVCATGQFQPEQGKTSCHGCAAGSFGSTADQTSAAHCETCAFGRFQSQQGQSSCNDCAPGKFTDAGTGVISCSNCAAGRYQTAHGRSVCQNCAVGRFNADEGASTNANVACTQCEAGTYQDATGAAECKGWTCCEEGRFIANADHTSPGSCQACGSGTYRVGKTCYDQQCLSWGSMCAAGFERVGADTTRTASCTECAAGSYRAASAGHELCTKCAAGTANASPRGTSASACQACVTGQYSANEGQAACESCGADKYGDPTVSRASAAHCKSCPALSPWSMCSKSCEGGTRTRWRAASSAPGAGVCPQDQTEACNTQECPSKHHCVYLKCRYKKNADGHYAIQVYHHRKDAPSVHQCKLYEGVDGSAPKCQCFCWYHDQSPALLATHAPTNAPTMS